MIFSGVQLLDSDSAGITMELEMQWDGNPNIVLDIQTTLGISLPVQVTLGLSYLAVHNMIFATVVYFPYISVHFPCCKRGFLHIYHPCTHIYI